MKNQMSIVFLLSALVACKSSSASSADGVPCTKAEDLYKQLEAANGWNRDLQDAKVVKEIEAAKAGLLGKHFAFKSCHFKGQGNDKVMFAPTEDGKDIDCTMAGGAGALKEFRRAAMELDSSKLRLDVSGTVKEVDGPHKSIELTECKVTAHE